jgi:aldose 1-epimerase
MIVLTAGSSKAEILPQMGAGLAGLWAGGRPVLRPWSGRTDDGPFALACNLLVPFSNRISRGGFSFDGRQHPVPANLPGEACPIHGDGFQRPWQLTTVAPDHANLHLTGGTIGPFLYDAAVSFQLTERSFRTRLSVTNKLSITLPFGLGLHPWFPRDGDTRLQFAATGHWPETPDHLPATPAPLPFDRGCPWQSIAPLPPGWINEGFSGWDGRARILQGLRAVSLQLASEGLGTALLYSPSDAADFFCFEPVSHPVDAHNLPGQPGLGHLALGETLAASMTLTWDQAA